MPSPFSNSWHTSLKFIGGPYFRDFVSLYSEMSKQKQLKDTSYAYDFRPIKKISWRKRVKVINYFTTQSRTLRWQWRSSHNKTTCEQRCITTTVETSHERCLSNISWEGRNDPANIGKRSARPRIASDVHCSVFHTSIERKSAGFGDKNIKLARWWPRRSRTHKWLLPTMGNSLLLWRQK